MTTFIDKNGCWIDLGGLDLLCCYKFTAETYPELQGLVYILLLQKGKVGRTPHYTYRQVVLGRRRAKEHFYGHNTELDEVGTEI